MSKLKLASLFDGIGGFPLSAMLEGVESVWSSEIDKNCIKATMAKLPSVKHYGSVTDIKGAEVEPVDIITFGSPCQDLSVAGKRAGLVGERSGLFMEAVRIIKEMRDASGLWNYNDVRPKCGEGTSAAVESGNARNEFRGNNGGTNDRSEPNGDDRLPRYAVWENVPGAFSSNGGKDFQTVLESLAQVAEEAVSIPMPQDGRWEPSGLVEGDGWSIAWRTLDAQFWGVPQRRKRIFLVCDFGGHRASEIFFERESMSGNTSASENARQGVTRGLENSVGKTIGYPDIANALKAKAQLSHRGDSDNIVYCIQGGATRENPESGPDGIGIRKEPAYTIEARSEVQAICVTGERTHALKAEGFDGSEDGTGRGTPIVFMTGPEKDTAYALRGQASKADKPDSTTYVVHASQDQTTSETHAHSLSANAKLAVLYDASGSIGATLTANNGDGVNNQTPQAVSETVRRLTPLEYARLQGFPDDWLEGIGLSDSAKYKALGNSVAIPCVRFILSCIAREG